MSSLSHTSSRAIVRFVIKDKKSLATNYSRRMYAIIRRFTPEAIVGSSNECYAELTGLRTFFKMSYAELAEAILVDLEQEIGKKVSVFVAKVQDFEGAIASSKKGTYAPRTYKEMNTLFKGASFVPREDRTSIKPILRVRKIKLSVPYIGKVK